MSECTTDNQLVISPFFTPQESIIFTCSTAIKYVTVPDSKLLWYYHVYEKKILSRAGKFSISVFQGILEIWNFLVLNDLDIV